MKYSVLKITKEGSNGFESSSAYSDLDELMDNEYYQKTPFKVQLNKKFYYMFQKGSWSNESMNNPVVSNLFHYGIKWVDFFLGITTPDGEHKETPATIEDLKLNGIRFTTPINEYVDERNTKGGIYQTATIWSPDDIAFVNINSPLVKEYRQEEKAFIELLKTA